MVHTLWIIVAVILFVSGIRIGWRWGIDDAIAYAEDTYEPFEEVKMKGFADELRELKKHPMR